MTSNPNELLAAIDALIDTHGAANPELMKELQQFRNELADHLAHQRKKDLANAGLRLTQLIKFAFDLLGGSG